MGRLIWYEWKRIWNSLLTRLAVAGCCLFLAFCVYSSIAQISAPDKDGAMVTGLSAVREQRRAQRTVGLTQERVDAEIGEYLSYAQNPDTSSKDRETEFLSEEAYRTYYLQKRELLQFLSVSYAGLGDDREMREIFEECAGEDFYAARSARRAEWLDRQEELGKITKEQRAYWEEQGAKIGELSYGYFGGFGKILDMQGWVILLMMAVCIGAAPVFAGEYQSKFDSLLLGMRYGRNKLIRAKLTASFLYATAVYWGVMLSCAAVYLLLAGSGGGELPIQLYLPSSFVGYPLTMAQGAALTLLLGYGAVLAILGITLFLSAAAKNTYTVVILAFLVILVPSFLYADMGGYLWQHVLALLPSKIIDFSFAAQTAYTVGGRVISLAQMMLIADLLLAASLPAAGYWKFKRHEVNK